MNLFSKACGATGPIQLVVERTDEPAVERHVLDTPFVTVGRDPRADLCLANRVISRRHAYLQLVSGRLFCLDLGSRFGTYVGNECHQSGWVERRQTIRIGPYRLRLDAGEFPQWASPEGEANGIALRSPESSRLPRLFLELWDRSDEPSVWQVERELALIGTSADCEVRVRDPSISAHHCSLLRTPTGIWMVDLLGVDGVMVNGTAVRYARVYDGDELHLGNSLIRLRYEVPRHLSMSLPHLTGRPTLGPQSWPEGAPPTGVPEVWTGQGGGIGRPPSTGHERPARFPAPVSEPVASSEALAAEWIPSDTTQAVESFNSLLFPVVDRFGLMQQQVLDQFQQSMMMLFQSFSSMHDEQTNILRQEFDQLRDLTQELVALRGELSGDASPSREVTDNPSGTAPRPNVSPAASAHVERTVGISGTHPAAGQERPAVGPGVAALRPGPGPEVSAGSKAQGTSDVKDRPAAARSQPEGGGGARHGADPGPAIHAQLRERIMAIQNEQRSSWQRILNLMPGRSQKKSVP